MPSPSAPFGTLLGHAPGGVAVYSSDYESVDPAVMKDRADFRNVVDGEYMGFKWQCVEFARRWLAVNEGWVFEDVGMAYDIFHLTSARRLSDRTSLPLWSFRNGSQRHPEVGAMLIWAEGGEFERTGHVAIVTEVHPDHLLIAEQNYVHTVWPEGQNWSRRIVARVAFDGGYWLRCLPKEGQILGWVMATDDPSFAEPRVELDERQTTLEVREVDGSPSSTSWLNEANPDEGAFVEMMKGHTLVDRPEDARRYVRMSSSLHDEIQLATTELHALFLHATDWVLQHQERWAPFNLPDALWMRIRKSWSNFKNFTITGRFDFSVSPMGIKVFEYNCDSASCHMECGKVQGKWAEHFGADEGEDPGAPLFDALVEAWRRCEVDGVLHIMIDDHPEERYHGLYMRDALEAAGVPTKILTGVKGLTWDDEHRVLDPDGVPIRWVWKSWSWETALDQIRAECEEDDLGLRRTTEPRLVDVLLDERVRVFEPLWTLIPSNKAILPILWQLFPDHPYLLECGFELTESLKASGYVAKPIVGRSGDNISIFGADNKVIARTEGRFDAQERIYQQLASLPKVGERYLQVCAFSVAGAHAGTCMRVDPTPVVAWNSDLWPLRVVDDEDHMPG